MTATAAKKIYIVLMTGNLVSGCTEERMSEIDFDVCVAKYVEECEGALAHYGVIEFYIRSGEGPERIMVDGDDTDQIIEDIRDTMGKVYNNGGFWVASKGNKKNVR
jgi:hypothetical protein